MVFHPLMTSGTLEQVPLASLLLALARARRSGVLAVRSEKRGGKICFERGVVCRATMDDDEKSTDEAMREMLQWTHGSFDMFYLQWQHPTRIKVKSFENVEAVAA